MAEYKIVTYRAAFLDWRVDVYLGDNQHVHKDSGYATRRGAVRSVKKAMRKALAPAKANPLRHKEEWFIV